MIIDNQSKFLFVGLGGAGQRHLRIFRELLPNAEFYGYRTTKKTPLLNNDFTIDNKSNIIKKYKISLINEISEINKLKPKLTIISVPNSLHFYYAKLAINAHSNVFVEKPGCLSLSDTKRLINLLDKKNLFFKVGYQRKYHPLFKLVSHYIKSKILGDLNKVEIDVSSYIPSWHPYEDFRDLYACRKKLGGGVITTECHEIEMVLDLFGKPSHSKLDFSNLSKDIIETPDTIKGILKYPDFNVILDISFFRNPSNRLIKFHFNRENLTWDINNQVLWIGKNKKNKIKLHLQNEELFRLQAVDILNFDHNETKKNLSNLELYTSLLDIHKDKIF